MHNIHGCSEAPLDRNCSHRRTAQMLGTAPPTHRARTSNMPVSDAPADTDAALMDGAVMMMATAASAALSNSHGGASDSSPAPNALQSKREGSEMPELNADDAVSCAPLLESDADGQLQLSPFARTAIAAIFNQSTATTGKSDRPNMLDVDFQFKIFLT